ncbi:RNA polymerase sigma factor [Bacteroides sp. AN502(2024)]|uniref:RNA polymerase sigma factor n=1 Tax=Bacteroides sp. AN502(2024) TaxID=3160599 RepID=UPI0035122A38
MEQIFRDFKAGRIDTFYQKMYPQLLLYAGRHLGKDYAFLAEDCVQDAIYQTYLHKDSLASTFAFKSFLYSCIYNATISLLRHQTAKENYLSAHAKEEEEENFLNSLIEQETLDMLWNAIEQLPSKYRELFELSFEQGLKNAEIANRLNISESAVKKRKAQFIALLRQHLSQQTNDEIKLILIVLFRLLNS